MSQKTGCYIPIPVVCDDCNKAPYIGENGNWWIGDEDTGVSARGSGEEVYSTEATRIGTWIDGKPIYRRVFQYNGTVPAATSAVPEVVLTLVPKSVLGNVDRLLKVYGSIVSATSGTEMPYPSLRFSITNVLSEGLKAISRVTSNVKDVVIVIEYTV